MSSCKRLPTWTPIGPPCMTSCFQCPAILQQRRTSRAKAQDASELDAEDPVFDSEAKFIAFRSNHRHRVLHRQGPQTLSDLLKFHANDEDKSAYIDASLGRLNFGKNKAYGESKNDRYRSAIKGFINKWAGHRISARPASTSRKSDQEGDKVQVHKLPIKAKRLTSTAPEALCAITSSTRSRPRAAYHHRARLE